MDQRFIEYFVQPAKMAGIVRADMFGKLYLEGKITLRQFDKKINLERSMIQEDSVAQSSMTHRIQ